MKTEPAKHILQSVTGGDTFFLRNYNMNLYRGCCHGCIYCDGRSACYQVKDFGAVRVKENALAILRSEIKAKRKPGIVGMGGMSDAYNPFEAEEKATQGALELFLANGFGAGVTTKSDLVTRDAALLNEIARYGMAHVTFSITTANDEIARKIEPNTAVSSARFHAMARLHEAGVLTGVWINPMLPFITDDEADMVSVLRKTSEAGGSYAVCFFELTLREGNREYFYSALDSAFPGLTQRYAREYGLRYELPVPRAEALYTRFQSECVKLGLQYTFKEINRLIRASGAQQLSLF